ncbi:MAG: hypothetical protein OHK0050_22470 [Roseiflexaceae bacterium]
MILATLLLTGCGFLPGSGSTTTTNEAQSGGGGLSPESVTRGFFEDLGRALKDDNLANEATREGWVERLAGYFAPNERDAQRIALDQALANFANDRAKLADDEVLTIEFRFDEPRRLPATNDQPSDQALVQIPNAIIFMQISRITERGTIPYYEQPISLDRVIGRADGSVPTIRIGNRWFLTEG